MAAATILNFFNSWIQYARIPFSCTRFGFAVLVWHFVVQLIFLAQMFFGTIKNSFSTTQLELRNSRWRRLDQLNSDVKSVFVCPMLAFVPDNMLSSSS